MFRIVTEFVPDAGFLLLCDHQHCGNMATAKLPEGTPESERVASVKPFIEGAIGQGWAIGIDAHLCPQHAERIAQGRRLVEVPSFSLKK
jgi:hypothetical protein